MPYLFILCAEGLSSLIDSAERLNDIEGGGSSLVGGTRVNHLLFADDCVILGRAKLVEWLKIQGFLSTYEKTSSQCLNMQKTTIFFSSSIGMSIRS